MATSFILNTWWLIQRNKWMTLSSSKATSAQFSSIITNHISFRKENLCIPISSQKNIQTSSFVKRKSGNCWLKSAGPCFCSGRPATIIGIWKNTRFEGSVPTFSGSFFTPQWTLLNSWFVRKGTVGFSSIWLQNNWRIWPNNSLILAYFHSEPWSST